MSVEGAPAPRELGWRGPILALLALTLLPITPLRVVTPIEQSIILLIPALAACALVAWWNGGRAGLALVWVVLAGNAIREIGTREAHDAVVSDAVAATGS